MHVKFIARGTGSASAAADYLLGERDAAGQPCEGVAVLRGDPDVVAAIADSLEFEHKYTSGVIAWSPDDRPTGDQIEAVLDEFEKTAWAGLEPDRYTWTAVEHRERGGGVHVHIFAARCDLETGRSLNIAPPGWRQTFDPLRDAFNHEHGWSRPDDPERARVQQPGHRAYIKASQLRAGLEHEDPRDPASGVPGAAGRARRSTKPRRRGGHPGGGRTRNHAPGQELRERSGPGDREPVATEGSVVRA